MIDLEPGCYIDYGVRTPHEISLAIIELAKSYGFNENIDYLLQTIVDEDLFQVMYEVSGEAIEYLNDNSPNDMVWHEPGDGLYYSMITDINVI
jgi:hypothetical protein